jgi:hypothetical protein
LPSGRLISPGKPESSELLLRMGHRGPRQMPPLATYFVDPRGLEIVRRWIEGLDQSQQKRLAAFFQPTRGIPLTAGSGGGNVGSVAGLKAGRLIAATQY